MVEIFSDISNDVKEIAEASWQIAITHKNPKDAAEFLNNVIEYCKQLYTKEEVEFLQFYFKMKMEMIKE